MSTAQLSETEVAHMRQILAQHDSEHKPMTTTDLNNPPREQYRFQKFPMMVYDLAHSHPSHDKTQPRSNGAGVETVHIPAKVVTSVIHSEDELQQVLMQGWSEKAPDFTEEREEPLSARYANEAHQVDEQIEAARRKPGRPRAAA
jgi:hypothetical protein